MTIVAVALQAGSGFGVSESNADLVLQSTSSIRPGAPEHKFAVELSSDGRMPHRRCSE